MKKFIIILLPLLLIISFTSCNSNKISELKKQKQDIEITSLKGEIEKKNITFDDQREGEQLIKAYFTYLEKKDYYSAWELRASEIKETGFKGNANEYSWSAIKLISIKGYIPPKKNGIGESATWGNMTYAPSNTPTVWFDVMLDVEPNSNFTATWHKGLNERFVNVVKDSDGRWRIANLSTGP